MNLNYKAMGAGAPIIIMHGLLGSLDNWQTIGRQLSEKYKVYLVDGRNHGKSPHADTHSYPEMADDLLAFMNQQKLEKAHLLGHSMGGKTVMQFAVTYPDRVLSMIVADMGMKAYNRHHDEVFDALYRIDLDSIERRSDAEEQMAVLIPDMGMRQFLLKSLDRTPEGKYEWKFNLDVLHDEYQRIIEGIESGVEVDVPVLFIRGGKSGYVKDEDLPVFKRNFPQAELVTIPHAGHWLHAEAPKEFLEALLKFLSAV